MYNALLQLRPQSINYPQAIDAGEEKNRFAKSKIKKEIKDDVKCSVIQSIKTMDVYMFLISYIWRLATSLVYLHCSYC